MWFGMFHNKTLYLGMEYFYMLWNAVYSYIVTASKDFKTKQNGSPCSEHVKKSVYLSTNNFTNVEIRLLYLLYFEKRQKEQNNTRKNY